MKLDKGVFTISIDVEMAWGYADQEISPVMKMRIRREPDIIKRLIELLEKYDVPATWAIVGKLLEKSEDTQSELWYDTQGLIKQVAASPARHEIASHSYAHIIYGNKNTSREGVRADIQHAAEIHKQHKLEFKSFVFPHNQEGFHDELKKAGIKAFRGQTHFPYYTLPKPVNKIGRTLDYYLPMAKTFVPTKHKSGLINIPDSLLLLHRKGLRKIVLPQAMISKIMSGIKQAIEEKEVFHLWFHPFNFTYETRAQFWIFEEVLKYAVEKRGYSEIEIMTMGEIADRV